MQYLQTYLQYRFTNTHPLPSSSGRVEHRGRIFGFTSGPPSKCAIGRHTSLLSQVGSFIGHAAAKVLKDWQAPLGTQIS